MKDIPVADVRNFVLVGHTGSGKTSLVDALLYKLGVNDRLGNPGDGTSMADWTDEEKNRKISIWAKPFDAVWRPKGANPLRLVMLDTPGYADFYGQMVAATQVADAALLLVDATAGVQVGTVRAWKRCEALGLPRAIAITGLDKENADFNGTVAALQDLWGVRCEVVTFPTADKKGVVDVLSGQSPEAEELRSKLTDVAAESSDELIEKVLNGETLSADELAQGLRSSVVQTKFIPIFAVMARQSLGLDELMQGFGRLMPSPADRPVKDESGAEVNAAADAPLVAQVWRSINDPFVGQLTLARIWGGTLKENSEIFNATKEQKERVGTIYFTNGKKNDPTPEAQAGDIVALAKLKSTGLNDTLCAVGKPAKMAPIVFPNPVASFAVMPKNQGDEDKLGQGLSRIADDDPTIHVQRNDETRELIITGMGDVQIDVAMERMKVRSKVEVTLSTPKVAYRETVTTKGEGHYKHKKQSGGRGQYGEVYLRIEPLRPGVDHWFVDGIVGTSIPRNFLPAIEKGLVEGMTRGAVAGYPVVNTMVTVYDGSSHDVDSSEIAFKIAARTAFKDGMAKAKPVLLEPIMNIRVTIPAEFMGDCTGDLNHKRGRIMGMDAEDGMQVIVAEVPQAEVFKYSSELRSMTGGRGSFEISFNRYDIVPSNVAQKVIAEAAKNKQAEEEE
ncbi:MAG TPA: elongation factor G [Kiritimatiellia bacterium]|jgi:elongation factor G|nr:elongation factor G [Kiritimatiellia bacterium]OQC56020.1 MAG: Elongation factor G [Verrucomicrobia bacterium ADurb.Bin018]MBP9571638.1 elongation factor G [Kiritimatiellia bacterium]HQF20480.1 elongation factor G [Kiritimatiellia bacterium]HQG74370.1 elongation factor G [Kiritimatiellia bacterium]